MSDSMSNMGRRKKGLEVNQQVAVRPPTLRPTDDGVTAAAIEELTPADLPNGWHQRTYPDTVPQFLLARLADPQAALVFAVPSIVLPATPSRNLLINPRHPSMRQVRLLDQQPVVYDEQLRL
jgi:hypothetical protein